MYSQKGKQQNDHNNRSDPCSQICNGYTLGSSKGSTSSGYPFLDQSFDSVLGDSMLKGSKSSDRSFSIEFGTQIKNTNL